MMAESWWWQEVGVGTLGKGEPCRAPSGARKEESCTETWPELQSLSAPVMKPVSAPQALQIPDVAYHTCPYHQRARAAAAEGELQRGP